MIHFPESHPRGSMKAQAFDSLQHVGSSHDRHFLSYPCQRIQTGLQTLERFSVNPVSFRILRNPCLAWDRRLPLTSTLLPGRDPSGVDSRVSTWLCRRRPWQDDVHAQARHNLAAEEGYNRSLDSLMVELKLLQARVRAPSAPPEPAPCHRGTRARSV